MTPTRTAWARVRGGTVPLGSPFGIPVDVSVVGVGLVVVLVAVSLRPTVQLVVPDAGPLTVVGVGLLAGLLLQASVLVHEISHCVVARMLGLRVRGLHLRTLAGITEIEGETDDPAREYLVAMAGPLATVLLACLGGALYVSSDATGGGFYFTSSGSVLDVLVFSFTWSNVLLALFNLLPGMPLDGGRVLRSVVWRLSGRMWTGTLVAARIGQVLGGLTTAVGIYGVTQGQQAALLTVVAGVYVGANAASALRQGRLERAYPHLEARVLLRPAITVAGDLPLAEALRRADLVGARSAVVADPAGRPTMVVHGSALDAVPPERRPYVPVSSVCATVRPGTVLDVALRGRPLLEAMQAQPASEYVVVDPGAQHRVVGVLVAVDVAAAVVR